MFSGSFFGILNINFDINVIKYLFDVCINKLVLVDNSQINILEILPTIPYTNNI